MVPSDYETRLRQVEDDIKRLKPLASQVAWLQRQVRRILKHLGLLGEE